MTTTSVMPNFQEWLKNNPPKCKCCNILIDFSIEYFSKRKVGRLSDVDGERVRGLYCNDCVIEHLAYLMNSRFVEKYNGNTIYQKQGKYYPYWDSQYYFHTLEACKNRLDFNRIAVIPWGMMMGSERHVSTSRK